MIIIHLVGTVETEWEKRTPLYISSSSTSKTMLKLKVFNEISTKKKVRGKKTHLITINHQYAAAKGENIFHKCSCHVFLLPLRSIENNLQIYDFLAFFIIFFLCETQKKNLSPVNSISSSEPNNEANRKFLLQKLLFFVLFFFIRSGPNFTFFLATFLCESSGRKVKVYKSFFRVFCTALLKQKNKKKWEKETELVILSDFACRNGYETKYCFFHVLMVVLCNFSHHRIIQLMQSHSILCFHKLFFRFEKIQISQSIKKKINEKILKYFALQKVRLIPRKNTKKKYQNALKILKRIRNNETKIYYTNQI